MGKYCSTCFTAIITLLFFVTFMPGVTNAAEPDQDTSPKPVFANDLRVIITQIAKATIPSVVHIEVTQQQVVPYFSINRTTAIPILRTAPGTKKIQERTQGAGYRYYH